MARHPILENAVMDLLWDEATWLTPSEVRAGLSRDVASTTVGTVLSRLHEKGRVERRKHFNGFQYRPADTREEHVASRMEAALESSRDRPLALLEFVDRLPDDDRSRLRKILGL
ncbi:MAG TPA: BlaI/MecI/CopY family transcriptional regulator [Acidimicrobiia bacterium]